MSIEHYETMSPINDLEFIRKLSTFKVLIVDDHRNMVKTLENMLISICAFKHNSRSVFKAYDGKEAINILTTQPEDQSGYIDLVLLDWNMPITPGIDVVRAVRNSGKAFLNKTPIIMITGESRAKDVSNAIYEGVDNYLLKPFLVDDLRKRMNPLLKQIWSGSKLKRAQNRRSEVRYDTEALKMEVEVEFYNDSRKKTNVVNISEHGLKIYLEMEALNEIKSVYFPAIDDSGRFANKADVVAFLPDEHGQTESRYAYLAFRLGFENKEIQSEWAKWTEAARKKVEDYRGQTL